MSKLLIAFASSVLFVLDVTGQTATSPTGQCPFEAAVVVTDKTGAIIRDLGSNDLLVGAFSNNESYGPTAEGSKLTNQKPSVEYLTIESIERDKSARRIIFVLGDAPGADEKAKQIENGVIGQILSDARAEDLFGLVSNNGKTVKLTSEKESIRAQVLSTDAPKKTTAESIEEGTKLFGKPQFGDSIVLFATSVGSGSQSLVDIWGTLVKNRVRLFTFSFKAPETPIYDLRLSKKEQPPRQFERSPLSDWSTLSGGLMVYEDLTPATYEITDSRLALLKSRGLQIYSFIVEPYRMTLRPDQTKNWLRMEMSAEAKARWQRAYMFYPRHIVDPCYVDAKKAVNR